VERPLLLLESPGKHRPELIPQFPIFVHRRSCEIICVLSQVFLCPIDISGIAASQEGQHLFLDEGQF